MNGPRNRWKMGQMDKATPSKWAAARCFRQPTKARVMRRMLRLLALHRRHLPSYGPRIVTDIIYPPFSVCCIPERFLSNHRKAG